MEALYYKNRLDMCWGGGEGGGDMEILYNKHKIVSVRIVFIGIALGKNIVQVINAWVRIALGKNCPGKNCPM
jgi:hypothetical protein